MIVILVSLAKQEQHVNHMHNMPYLMLHCCKLLLFCIIIIIMFIPFNELVQGHSGCLEMVQFHIYHHSQVHWCIGSNKVQSYKMQNCTLIA
jgi:hypothetical protein